MGTTTLELFSFLVSNYTIPRNKWELQLDTETYNGLIDYNIPRKKWEQQLYRTTERNRLIIPYQEINGNYNNLIQ